MLLLDNGQTRPDGWVRVADGQPLPTRAPTLLPLARLLAEGSALAPLPDRPLGVWLASHEGAETLAPHLSRLALVAVDFPRFRDGRGFTTARTLRERYGFAGEIRATGHVLPDQFAFLLRCGFTSVALREGQDPAVWRHALAAVTVTYQRGMDGAGPVSLLRRRFAPAGGAP